MQEAPRNELLVGRDSVWSLPWHKCRESISWNNEISQSSQYPKLFWNAWRLTSERDVGCNSREREREKEKISEREATAPVARQLSCYLFPEIFFTTVFGIKSMNNLLLNKFKCKTTRATRDGGREKNLCPCPSSLHLRHPPTTTHHTKGVQPWSPSCIFHARRSGVVMKGWRGHSRQVVVGILSSSEINYHVSL